MIIIMTDMPRYVILVAGNSFNKYLQLIKLIITILYLVKVLRITFTNVSVSKIYNMVDTYISPYKQSAMVIY